MPANKYALLRYRIIDKCIRNKYKPYPSKEELRQACEEALYGSSGDRISDSTIEKDLYAMRFESDLGYEAPIKFSKGERGYYYEDPDYSIDAIPLNDDDVEAIRFAATTLFQFKDVEVFRQFGFAIEKIFDRLNITQNVEDEAISQYVQFESVPTVRGSEHLGLLLYAIKERNPIRFDYAAFSREGTRQYTMHPYLLKEYRNRWYLIGHNPDRNTILTFGLDRITDVERVEERFDPDPSFSPDLYFKHSIGITADAQEPVEVLLSFTPLQGKYIKSQPLHASQQIVVDSETELRIRLFVRITYELVMQILGFGKDINVLEPKALREQVRGVLEQSIAQYG